MKPPQKPGRKPKFAPTEWRHFSMRLPRELWKAWGRLLADQGGQRAEMVMRHLEGVLVKEGYLRVTTVLDRESGGELRGYQAVERG